MLALLLLSPASFEAGRTRRTVNGLVALPFVALLFSNLYHAQIDPYWPALPAALAALVALPLAWSVRNAPGVASPMGVLTVVTLCAGLYGYGATSVIDVQLDFSTGQVFPAPVLSKHESRGSRSHSYYLDVPAWGPRTGPSSIEVSSSTYDGVSVGENVCITLHPGALDLPWFTSAVCAAGGTPQQ